MLFVIYQATTLHALNANYVTHVSVFTHTAWCIGMPTIHYKMGHFSWYFVPAAMPLGGSVAFIRPMVLRLNCTYQFPHLGTHIQRVPITQPLFTL